MKTYTLKIERGENNAIYTPMADMVRIDLLFTDKDDPTGSQINKSLPVVCQIQGVNNSLVADNLLITTAKIHTTQKFKQVNFDVPAFNPHNVLYAHISIGDGDISDNLMGGDISVTVTNEIEAEITNVVTTEKKLTKGEPFLAPVIATNKLWGDVNSLFQLSLNETGDCRTITYQAGVRDSQIRLFAEEDCLIEVATWTRALPNNWFINETTNLYEIKRGSNVIYAPGNIAVIKAYTSKNVLLVKSDGDY